MAGPQCFLADGEGASVERLGILVAARLLVASRFFVEPLCLFKRCRSGEGWGNKKKGGEKEERERL